MDKVIFRNISARIRKLKKARRIPTNKVLCQRTGIPESSFSDMLNNRARWKVDYLIKIAFYFGMTMDYIILGTDKFLLDYSRAFSERYVNNQLIALRKDVNKIIRKTGRRQDWIAKKIRMDKTVLNKILKGKSKLAISTQSMHLFKICRLVTPLSLNSKFSKN